MKTTFLLLAAVLAVMSGFSLCGAEPRETVDYYFSFFNPGGPEGLEKFRSCFVPEERSKIKTAPNVEIRAKHPVGRLNILDEAKTGITYEIRYRLEKRPGLGFIVLENRDGQWLINPSLSSSGRKDALSKNEPVIPVPLDPDDPVPQPLPPPPPPVPAVPSGWQPGPSPEWFVNFQPASEKAREEKRHLLVLCTGADWCSPCKRLAREVLQSEEFKEYAAQHLVLLYLNFPRRTQQPADQVKHNQEIRRKFGFRGGVPSYILMDPDGQIVRRRSGYLPLPAFMEFIQTEKPQQTQTRSKPAEPAEPAKPAKPAKPEKKMNTETREIPVQQAEIPATPASAMAAG